MSIALYGDGFVVELYNNFTVKEVIHNGRGHKNTIDEYTHHECASIIPDNSIVQRKPRYYRVEIFRGEYFSQYSMTKWEIEEFVKRGENITIWYKSPKKEEELLLDACGGIYVNTLPDWYIEYEPLNIKSKQKLKPFISRESMNADDFGPQRYCSEGNPLDMSCETGLWIDPLGNILMDHTYEPLRDDFGVDVPEGRMDCFEEVKCTNEKVKVKDRSPMVNLEYYMYKNKLDYSKLKKAKLDRSLARWIYDNKETLNDIYKDIDDDWNEHVPCSYIEEVNSSNDDETESNISSVGISTDENTYMSYKALNFWRTIIWPIGHNSKLVKTKARKALKDKIISFEEYRYLLTITHVGKQRKEDYDLTTKWSQKQKDGKYKHIPIYREVPYADLIDEQWLKPFYKSSVKKQVYRVLHFYSPTKSLPEGFLLSIDWDRLNGFHNKQSWRLLGADKAYKFYQEKIQEAHDANLMVVSKDVRKVSKVLVYNKDMWNMWLENEANYMATTKSMFA